LRNNNLFFLLLKNDVSHFEYNEHTVFIQYLVYYKLVVEM